MKITKVYTKTGDMGTTAIVGGARLSKSDARIEAYGTVDELSCHLGLLAAEMAEGDDRNNIFRIQNTLFNVCSHLATDQATTPLYPSCRIPEGEVEWMEQRIDECNALFSEFQGFILPGGCRAAAQAHVARAVCRRAERRVVALSQTTTISAEILKYINRLSDYLFVLAKKINLSAKIEEKIWVNACK